MADDACVGFKRRITEVEEDNRQETTQQQEEDAKESFVIVASPKEELETGKTSPMKVKCYFESGADQGDNQDLGFQCEVGFVSGFENNQEMLDSVTEKVQDFGVRVEERDNHEGGFVSSLKESKEVLHTVCKKKETFGEVVKETKICQTGFESNFERKEEVIVSVECETGGSMKVANDILNRETGLSGVQEFEKVNEQKNPAVEVEMTSVIEGSNGITSSSLSDENRQFKGERIEVESFLEVKKKRLLAAIEVGSIFADKSHVNKVTGFASQSGIDGNENGFQEMHKKVQNEADGSGRNSLKIEVIDDTAVIESVRVPKSGNGNVKGAGVMGFAKGRERNGKKNEKQEADGKKAKQLRRKAKDTKKRSESSQGHQNLTHFQKDVDGTKRVYSREKLEALRFISVVDQRKRWRSIYTGLAPDVAKEYDSLVTSKQKNICLNFYPQQQFGKKGELPGLLGETSSEIVDNEIGNIKDAEMKNIDILDPTFGDYAGGKDTNEILEGECSEDYDSDDYYGSIQRPALLVEGEPDFDSGPPEDGLEYLRRVRWEAAQIPKVKVAKIDKSELKNEQSVYMPQIPEIAKCAEHLLPLKQWEDEFLADFSELRLALSCFSDSVSQMPGTLESISVLHKEKSSSRIPESIILEKFKNLRTDDVHSNQPIDASNSENCQSSMSNVENMKTSESLENPTPKASVDHTSSNYPTLSAVIKMSSVARASMLRKRISLLETTATLSRGDCAWLFALCAAVDTPLDADMCAAIRSLLRKCASLRAEKSEVDDEIVMLNILATIAGRYFGQSEN